MTCWFRVSDEERWIALVGAASKYSKVSYIETTLFQSWGTNLFYFLHFIYFRVILQSKLFTYVFTRIFVQFRRLLIKLLHQFTVSVLMFFQQMYFHLISSPLLTVDGFVCRVFISEIQSQGLRDEERGTTAVKTIISWVQPEFNPIILRIVKLPFFILFVL